MLQLTIYLSCSKAVAPYHFEFAEVVVVTEHREGVFFVRVHDADFGNVKECMTLVRVKDDDVRHTAHLHDYVYI